MADPIPVDHTKKYNKDQTFFTKGNDESSGSYEHIGGEEDLFIIKVNGNSFQLHRKTLKETLLDLKTQSSVSVRNLDSEHSESFRSIVEALRLLYGSKALYEIILTDILDIFSDVNDVSPGTLAAFFIGCFTEDKFPGPMGCSPKCAASLPPSEGTPGFANCDDLVLIYIGDTFSSLNQKQSRHAYIYIEDDQGDQRREFTGFTRENFNQLKDTGVENVSLVFGKRDGSYSEITSPISIDELPHKKEVIKPNVAKTELKPLANTQEPQATSSGGIAFIVIVIALVILFLVILYKVYHP